MDCTSCPVVERCLIRDQSRKLRLAERLVGVGFRCWMAGFDTGDIQCWESAWRIYSDKLGPDAAKTVIAELGCWARVLNVARAREIRYFPFYHPLDRLQFCEDECTAIGMIAAGQHGMTDIVRDSACALIGSHDCAVIEEAAFSFAHTLQAAGIKLRRGILSDMHAANIKHSNQCAPVAAHVH